LKQISTPESITISDQNRSGDTKHGIPGASIIPNPDGSHEARIIESGPLDEQVWKERLSSLGKLLGREVPETWGNMGLTQAETPDGGREGSAQAYRRSVREAGSALPESVRLDGDLGKRAEAIWYPRSSPPAKDLALIHLPSAEHKVISKDFVRDVVLACNKHFCISCLKRLTLITGRK
jgi:hypothetical protein